MINQFFDSLSCAVTRTGPEAAIGQRALPPPTNAVCFGSAITSLCSVEIWLVGLQ